MRQQAAALGIANYTPMLHPSEIGYALALPSAVADGWADMHAALVAQTLLHMRAAPLAALVGKAFLFAAYDGCCEEQNAFFGVWRPAQLRQGPGAEAPYTQPRNLPQVEPLPAAAAYAIAAALLDVPSGRAAGVFVVDHTARAAQAGSVQPPSCVAFESMDGGATPPLAVLFTVGHDLGSRTPATVTLPTDAAAGAQLLNGYGTPMPLSLGGATAGGVNATLSIAPLPQYLVLSGADSDTTAASVCATLQWAAQ